jgi:hypothetical protein
MDWAVVQISPTTVLGLNQKDLLEVRRTEKKLPHCNFAVRLNELILHNSRTWFDEGDIRLDTLVAYGNVTKAKAVDFYHPRTFSFPRVADRSIESCGKADLRACEIRNRVKRNCTCAAGCRRDRKRDLSGYSSRNKQSHRCLSASFVQLTDNLDADEHPDGHLKVKDLLFTQEILAQ